MLSVKQDKVIPVKDDFQQTACYLAYSMVYKDTFFGSTLVSLIKSSMVFADTGLDGQPFLLPSVSIGSFIR